MNEFLNRIYFENKVGSYFLIAIIILVVVIIKRYLARTIAGFIFHFVNRVWKDVDKKVFINLVVRPLGFFLAVMVAVISLHNLHFPEQLNVDLYRVTLIELLHGLGSFVIVLSFIRLLLRMIDFIAIILHIRADQTEDTTDNQLIVFFKDFFKVVLVIVGLLMIVKFVFGFKISNLLTGLSLVGAAIALALRESLENLIASFIIFFDKPFSLGDTVKVHNFTGTVEKIGLRSTRIRTDHKTFITVPNKQMVDSILDNHSLRTQRKGELRLDLGLSTTSVELDQLLINIKKILDRPEIESSTVLLNDITQNSFQVIVDYFTGPIIQKEFNTVKEQINFQVLKLLESMKLEISGAATDVKISGKLDQ
ncbi:MAG: mechanosensitive ion channel domain-containing protein [Chitinophagaceae bacterium]